MGFFIRCPRNLVSACGSITAGFGDTRYAVTAAKPLVSKYSDKFVYILERPEINITESLQFNVELN